MSRNSQEGDMSETTKRQYCAYCGEYLGEYPSTYGLAECKLAQNTRDRQKA